MLIMWSTPRGLTALAVFCRPVGEGRYFASVEGEDTIVATILAVYSMDTKIR